MRTVLLLTLLLCGDNNGFAQKAGDAILGQWLKLPKRDLIIEVYKTKGQYNGRINWAKSPDKPAGFIIIENLKYNTKSNSWEKGKIRDPNSSTTYSAEVKLADQGNLIVKGYKGARFFGISRTFARLKPG